MSQQHAAVAAAGLLGATVALWAITGRVPAATGTVAGTVDCSAPSGSAEACPAEVVLTLRDSAGHQVAVPLDRTVQTATFAVSVPPGTYSVLGNGASITGPDGRPLSVTVTAGHTTMLHLGATPLSWGQS